MEGKISRKEFGLVWNAMTEAGQVVVGDEIRIQCEIQLIRQEHSTADSRRTAVESTSY